MTAAQEKTQTGFVLEEHIARAIGGLLGNKQDPRLARRIHDHITHFAAAHKAIVALRPLWKHRDNDVLENIKVAEGFPPFITPPQLKDLKKPFLIIWSNTNLLKSQMPMNVWLARFADKGTSYKQPVIYVDYQVICSILSETGEIHEPHKYEPKMRRPLSGRYPVYLNSPVILPI